MSFKIHLPHISETNWSSQTARVVVVCLCVCVWEWSALRDLAKRERELRHGQQCGNCKLGPGCVEESVEGQMVMKKIKIVKVLQFTLPFQKDNKLLSRDSFFSSLSLHQHTLPQKHLVLSKHCSLNFNSLAFRGKSDSGVPCQRNIIVITPPRVNISRFAF